MAINMLIFICLPLPSDWTSSDDFKCGTDNDLDKAKCAIPMAVTTFSLLLVAGFFGSIGGNISPGMPRTVLNGIAFLFALTATVVWLGNMAIIASMPYGYKWKSYDDAGAYAAQGYAFFSDFAIMWLLLKYTGSAAFNACSVNPFLTKKVFASAAFFYTFFQGIYFWSLNACANNDDELQCSGPIVAKVPIGPLGAAVSAGGGIDQVLLFHGNFPGALSNVPGSSGTGYTAIDDWKMNMIVACWSIAFAAMFCALPSIFAKQPQGAQGSSALLGVAGLLYFIANCGIANDAAKWIPDSDFDQAGNDTNTFNRYAAASFFGLLAFWVPVGLFAGTLHQGDGNDEEGGQTTKV
jgi:hypothetical protein